MKSQILHTVYTILFLASFATLIYLLFKFAGGAANCTF